MDYKQTLNLPSTVFPMRANLPQAEPRLIAWWDEIDLYRLSRELRRGAPKYVLHDGPPYGNGTIHIGQALNKALKDIVARYKLMRGYDSPYVPGWDTQGLPTEMATAAANHVDRHLVGALEWRRLCREEALKWVGIQREQFRRLGVRGDWAHPYLTLSPEYQAKQVEAFGKIVERGLIYRSKRPVYWCYQCETALAEAEVEYRTKRSPVIHVAFRLDDPSEKIREVGPDEPVDVIVWTTTPWTIPGNVATALHPRETYVIARSNGRTYVVAEALLAATAKECALGDPEVVARYTGSRLVGLTYQHPFLDRTCRLVTADYVAMDQGTGCVHTAPGHGHEDYQTALAWGLEVVSPLDDKGRFTEGAGPELVGLVCDQNNDKVTDILAAQGVLLSRGEILHEYPHCWRVPHNPVIFRALEQWFMDLDSLRAAAQAEIAKAEWVPAWGQARIAGMVDARPDWCLSRQRVWGVPIPAFYCTACNEPILTRETAVAFQALVEVHGADVWFERDAAALTPPGLTCPKCGGREFRKETDIQDVWFDSGVSHYAVQRVREELAYPADLYLEGDDQYQCWFQSSLWVACGLGDGAPFRTVLGHGFFIDDNGQKMSKSRGNIVGPEEIVERYGADVLRLWFIYADFRAKMPCSESVHKLVADTYRTIRNAWRFQLMNVADFDPTSMRVPLDQLTGLDRYVISRLRRLVARVARHYDAFDLHLVYHDVNAFCATDLSALYHNAVKDALYCDAADSEKRRRIQTVLWETAVTVAGLLAPVLAFTTEEVWQHLRTKNSILPLSVHLSDFPDAAALPDGGDLESGWALALAARELALRELETLKTSGVLTNPLEAELLIRCSDEVCDALGTVGDLPAFLGVSRVEVERAETGDEIGDVVARPGSGGKCERCWRRDVTVATQADHPTLCARCAEVVRGRE